MKRFTLLVFSFLVASLTGPLRAEGGPDLVKLGPHTLKASDYLVGSRIPDLSFVDIDGKAGKLSDYADNSALVIAMNLSDCPVCREFSGVFKTIEAAYEPRGVAFLMVNGNALANIQDLKQSIAQLGFKARYLPDLDHEIASALDAQTSSEVFVLDRARTLVYRGPISDQYGLGYELSVPRNNYLHDALESALAGGIVAAPALMAPGCALGIAASTTPEPPVTFNNRISRIIQYNCQSCHRPGESAPFPLITYDDVKGHAGMIRYVLKNKIMPPWYANPQYGTWSNDASLNENDQKDLLAWLNSSMPEGDAQDAALPRQWPQGLEIGKPDMSFPIQTAISVPANGVVPYQYRYVDTGLTKDIWVNAMEIDSPNPQLIHHVLVYLRRPDQIANGPRDGIAATDELLASRVPGTNAYFFAPGLGRIIPKGSQLVYQIHVTPNGVAGDVLPSLALKLSTSPNLTEVNSYAAVNATFLIPAGDSNYKVEATTSFAKKTRLTSFMPHMHLRGRAFRYEVTFPDGTSQIVLDVPKYDFNWQLRYVLATPLDVPAGTTVKATAWYDNSTDNPANPDPTVSVGWGEQTTDEMMIGFMEGYSLP